MSDRERILQALRANQPEPLPDPERVNYGGGSGPSLIDSFTLQARNSGSTVHLLENRSAVASLLQEGNFERVWSNLDGVEIPGAPPVGTLPEEPDKLDLVLMEGLLGVGENAAIWVPFTHPAHRPLPYVTRHLFLLLSTGRLVESMHDAYERLQGESYGFGAFIAGPSKTADIEQRLVMGAHGPLSLTVALIRGE